MEVRLLIICGISCWEVVSEMKRILVIGAGEYQMPLIKRITELGHEAYCVDKKKNSVGFKYATGYKTIDILNKDGCLKYAKELNISAVMTYGATISLPTVSYIASKLGLVSLPEETAEISKNKYRLKVRLYENGLNIKGDFFEIHSPEEIKNYRTFPPIVIKPSDGSGSKGVSIIHNEDELENAIIYAFQNARYNEVYIESFIEGEEYSVEAFVSNGEIYIYAIVKTTFKKEKDGSVIYGHRTPSGLGKDDTSLIEKEIKKAIRALDITIGSVNFDVILSKDDGKPYIIDCGIRVGQNLIASHLVPLSRGVSIIDNTIKLFLGEKIDAKPKKNDCIATRLLIYRPGAIEEIKPMDGVVGKNGVVDVVMRKQVGDLQGEYKEKSDTCGWVIARGSTPDEAERNAQNAKDILENYIIIKQLGESK